MSVVTSDKPIVEHETDTGVDDVDAMSLTVDVRPNPAAAVSRMIADCTQPLCDKLTPDGHTLKEVAARLRQFDFELAETALEAALLDADKYVAEMRMLTGDTDERLALLVIARSRRRQLRTVTRHFASGTRAA